MGRFDAMPSESRMSNDFLRPGSVWRYDSELKPSSKRPPTPLLFKDRIVQQTPSTNRDSKFQDKIDTWIPVGQPHTHTDEITIPRKRPGRRQRRSRNSGLNKDEEIVRYMSNGPSNLQNMYITGEKHQEKALDTGVLDLDHLRKCRHEDRRVPTRHSISASFAANAPPGLTNAGADLSLSFSSLDGMMRKRTDESQSLDLDFPSPHSPNELQKIVLLLPKDLPRNSSSSLLRHSELRSSFDGRMVDIRRKSFSDAFHTEINQPDVLHARVPYSSPLLPGAEATFTGNEPPSSMQFREKPDMLLEGIYANKSRSKMPLLSPAIPETYTKLDRVLADLTPAKGRSPSPNRQFSIGLGRMSRSFSSKESLPAPQLVNTPIASGPVKSKGSVVLENSNVEKGHAPSRGRPSPLRRLLDPLLKPKAAHLHSVDVGPLDRNLNISSHDPVNTSKSVSSEKHVTSIIHAHLRFTVKNGLPLFKFVVDNNECQILATTVKKLTESGQDDSGWIYTFYSIHEMKNKKTSSWMNQGNKGKGSGYAYTVLGQMKVSSSKYQNLATKSVLFGVELGHANRETAAASTRHAELAAIVTSSNREESDQLWDSTENGLTKSLVEDLNANNTTVILADDVHGFPNEGAPSPLIDRWKSEGSCDCGGWDIGCKFRVLTSQSHCYKLQPTRACPAPSGFNLFVQGGTKDKRPIFSLAPSKRGIYSVKFSTSISLLQAFSICVSVLNNEKSLDLLGTRHPPEAPQLQEPTSAGLHTKGLNRVQGEAPLKYASMPPYSPVGRV